MQPKSLSPTLSVSPQISPSDVAEAHRQGFRSIICNRPDGEDAGQPSFEEIEAAASAQNMTARHIPIVPGTMTDTDVAAFGAALAELPKPILAYCRSGARSTALWTKSQS